jgi:signal transduction histidine kinase/DNA-binding response OmpR family regulator/CHASE3 domain sensor protein
MLCTRPVPESQDRKVLTRRLSLAIGIPTALLLGVGLVLWMQVAQMRDMSSWVDHTDQVIARLYEVQRDIALQESALRGYLISGDRSLFEDNNYAQPRAGFSSLRGLVKDNLIQTGRIEEAARHYENWAVTLDSIQDPKIERDALRTQEAISARRKQVELARSNLKEVLLTEQKLRNERSMASIAANKSALMIAAVLFIALAAVFAFVTRSQVNALANTYIDSLKKERETRRVMEEQAWRRNILMQLSRGLQGELSLEQIGQQVIDKLASAVHPVIGAFYVGEPDGYRRYAGFGMSADAPTFLAHGDGVLARVVKEQVPVFVDEAPGHFLKVKTGLGEAEATNLALIPAVLDGITLGVMELGFFQSIEPRSRELFENIGESIGLAVRSTQYRMRLRELLEESRRQTEELQTQQEELRVANEELQDQSSALRTAQAQLEERKEELEVSNTHLVRQRDALELVQKQLGDKADELERASRYKSEFLANMSHELRTPLNSTLILAKLLADNKHGNLNAEQIKFASTIYGAGNDLLALINDILDLSKIEAGKVDVHATHTRVERLCEPVTRVFEPIAKQKSLAFHVSLDVPYPLFTDEQRLQQILKNLLSNAFKFTERGGVRLSATHQGEQIVFTVTDTGIGIPAHQQDVIFEAFRQADGTTNRKFGGTGLGLSISRDLAILLGGALRVESEPGKGSSFILTLPRMYQAPQQSADAPPPPVVPAVPVAPRRSQQNPLAVPAPAPHVSTSSGRRLLLIVEDDETFAETLGNLANSLDFEFKIARTADEGVRLALEHLPAGVVLDIKLPDHSGLSVLDRLKQDPRTRHIPVHVCSATESQHTAFAMGAAGYMMKPVPYEQLSAALTELHERFTRVRRLLVVEDDAVQRSAIEELLRTESVEIVAVESVALAIAELGKAAFDCIVTDLSLPDASGFDLIEHLAQHNQSPFPPVIVYTARMLTAEEEQRLRRYSSSIIIKGARSPERLLDEVTLFLHQVEADLPADRRRMLREARDREAALTGRKILLAEDDARNIFALAHVLEPKGIELVLARNGAECVNIISERDDIDLVLMDIMMPELDGLAATRQIRAKGGRWAKLPIIALTAKAMPDDQDKCIAAGANDYIPKPLDVEMLLSLIRVWMPK